MKNNIKKHFVVILLGILGTGIYSRVIDPNWDNTVVLIGGMFSSWSSSYLNYLYANIGDGIKEIFSYYTYAFIFGSGIVVVLLLTIKVIIDTAQLFLSMDKEDSKIEKELKPKKKQSLWIRKIKFSLVTVYLLITVTYILSTTIKHHYTYNAIIYIEKSLDIVAPVVSELERLKLKAQYRQVNSYERFEVLDSKLKYISEKHKIDLPQFKIIVK